MTSEKKFWEKKEVLAFTLCDKCSMQMQYYKCTTSLNDWLERVSILKITNVTLFDTKWHKYFKMTIFAILFTIKIVYVLYEHKHGACALHTSLNKENPLVQDLSQESK